MTPKEKAKELFDKMLNEIDKTCDDYFTAKQCALMAVDEILKVSLFFKLIAETEYWEEVKKEIEKL